MSLSRRGANKPNNRLAPLSHSQRDCGSGGRETVLTKDYLKSLRLRAADSLLGGLGYRAVKEVDLVDFYLHKYSSYEEYRDTQVRYNLQKITNVWADEATLKQLSEQI